MRVSAGSINFVGDDCSLSDAKEGIPGCELEEEFAARLLGSDELTVLSASPTSFKPLLTSLTRVSEQAERRSKEARSAAVRLKF